MKENEITPSEYLRFQLLRDMLHLKRLDWRISYGKTYLQPERGQEDEADFCESLRTFLLEDTQ